MKCVMGRLNSRSYVSSAPPEPGCTPDMFQKLLYMSGVTVFNK
uniref:Uncharacterized protein n=1 Tax=Anguilla anguilla TaxID=7936 RepID=A0A0E9PCG7_ANGAN